MDEWNRNTSQIYKLDGNKIISKTYKKPIFLQRELFFYNLFQKNSLIKTPRIYNFDKLILQTYFIETEEKDIFQTTMDWAKIHSYFIKNPVENNQLLIYHNIQKVISYVLENIGTFDKLDSVIGNKLSSAKMNKNIITLLHGDLQQKNMVTFKKNNYYFDFELGGLGHPARDITSMIISNPNKKDELITSYRQQINFDYSGIEEDIDNWLIARTAQLYILFNKKDGTKEQKKAVEKKLLGIIRDL